MKRILSFLLGLLIIVAGIIGLGTYWTFYQPLPDHETSLIQPALKQSVDIYWDSFGVPHIYAQNKHDLYYTLGYVHAQDRLWQMTISQMAAEGRFSEFLGEEFLPLDIMQRTIGFQRTAQNIEKKLSDTTKQYLQAYAQGINSYANSHPQSLPIQFTLANMEPIPWSTTSTIAITRLMAWELNIAWRSELVYSALAKELPAEQFNELVPDHPALKKTVPADTANDTTASLLALLELDHNLRGLIGYQGSHTGSNAWAIASDKSTTGAPMLAGDPHLGLNIPAKWYEVHLNVNGQNLSGATIPGTPAVILGRNDHLAWSTTNLMLDDTDFFREAVNPDSSQQYLLDTLAGEPLYENFELQKEVISIKNEADTVITRRVSRHGPIISDIHPDPSLINDRVIAMKWTGFEPSNEIGALLTMNWAQSFDEFRRGAKRFKVPGQNIIYADRSGTIARLSVANIPVRNGNPILVRDGWDPSQDWQGYVPFDEQPSVINPEYGWVANANNKPVDKDYPYYLSAYWEPDARYERIDQYLSADEELSPENFQQMQNDTYSVYAHKLTQQILPVLKQRPDHFETAIAYLKNWDYSYQNSETAASIMEVFLLKLSENTFKDEMSEGLYRKFIRFSTIPERAIIRFLKNGSSFFSKEHTQDKAARTEIIFKSMDEAITYLRNKFGEEPFEWRWEQLHTLTLQPPLFGQIAQSSESSATSKLVVNNILSEGPYPVSGHGLTINNGEYSWNDPFKMILGPSIRRIIDLSEPEYSLSIIPGGQSERPFSPYYSDQLDSWLNGQYKFLYRKRSSFNARQYDHMKLSAR